MQLFRTTLIKLFVVFFLAPSLSGQMTRIPRNAVTGAHLGASIGRGLSTSMSAMVNIRRQVAEFNKRITITRKRYFRLYPDKPGFDETAEEFAELLQQKDYMILVNEIQRRIQNEMSGSIGVRHYNGMMALAGATDEDWDKGIRVPARLAYKAWVDEMYAIVDKEFTNLLTGGLASLGKGLDVGLAKALPAYDRYVQIRDFVEFKNAGRESEYFRNAIDYVSFVLQHGDYGPPFQDAYVAKQYEVLVGIFGETALLDAAEEIVKSGLRMRRLPLRPNELGIPDSACENASEALAYLAGQKASIEGYALEVLRTIFQREGFDDGRATFDAMVAEHGRSAVLRAFEEIRGASLDMKTGLGISGKFEGLTLYEMAFKALPIEGDPGRERLMARKEAWLEEQRRKNEAAMAAQTARKNAEGRALSIKQYEGIREALEYTKQLEIERGLAGLPRKIIAFAGLWNEFGKYGNEKLAGLYASLALQSMSREYYIYSYEREKLKELVGFAYKQSDLKKVNLVPVEEIQREWIESGLIQPSQAIDMSMTPWKYYFTLGLEKAQTNLDGINKQIATNSRYRESKAAEIEANEMLLAYFSEKLATFSDSDYRNETAAQIAQRSYENTKMALRLLAWQDMQELTKLNWDLDQDVRLVLENWSRRQQLVYLATYFWDEYLRTEDQETLGRMNRCLSLVLSNLDQTISRPVRDLLYYMGDWKKHSKDPKPLPIRPIAAGSGSDSYPTVASVEHFELLLDWDTLYRDELRPILRRSFGMNVKGLKAKKEAVHEVVSKMQSVERSVNELDTSLGSSPRFSQLLNIRWAEPEQSVVVEETRESRPQRESENQSSGGPGENRRGGGARVDKPIEKEIVRDSPEGERVGRRGIGSQTEESKKDEPVGDLQRVESQYEAFVAAFKRSRDFDQKKTEERNAKRSQYGLKALPASTAAQDHVQLTFAFWNQYLDTGESTAKRRALSVLGQTRQLDGSLYNELKQKLIFTFDTVWKWSEGVPSFSIIQEQRKQRGEDLLEFEAELPPQRETQQALKMIELYQGRLGKAELELAELENGDAKASVVNRKKLLVERERSHLQEHLDDLAKLRGD